MKNLFALLLIAGLFAACNNKNNMNENANTATGNNANEARMQAFYDQVINAHNAAAMDSFCTNGFTDHSPDMNHSGKGIDDNKASMTEFFTAFPDIKVKPHSIVSRGDTVWSYVTMTGTNSGSMGPNMPATNKTMDVEGVDIVVLDKDGKATDRWGFFEERKMMEQLGLMKQPDMNATMAESKTETGAAAKEGPMEKAGKKADKGLQKIGIEKKK